jgi:ribosomal protein S18 acetylase RimI-like enzyme
MSTQTVEQATLPSGFTAGPLTDEYEPGAVELINLAYRRMNGGGSFTTLEEMRMDWRSEDFNRATDTQIVLGPGEMVVGYIDNWSINALHVRQYSMGHTHPGYQGRGIGRYLMGWATERACQKAALAPDGARVVLHQSINNDNQAAYELLTANGWTVARQSYRMEIEFDQAPDQPQIPEGILIRPMAAGTAKEEARAALQANYEAFADHWGFVEEPFEEYYKRWYYYLENDPNTVPEFWFLALDGQEVAGVALCNPQVNEDPDMSWVWQLSVRRPWRKCGLGLALLRYSFGAFYRIGRKRAALGVDADSLTGATRLYEKAGMQVKRINNTYEYEVRPGTDLMKKEIT